LIAAATVEQQSALKSKQTSNNDMGYNANLAGFLQYANMFNGGSVPTSSTSHLNYDDSKLKETNQSLNYNGHNNNNNWFINALTQYSMAAAVTSSTETSSTEPSSTSPSSSSSSSSLSAKNDRSLKYLEKNSVSSSSISCSNEPSY